MKVISYARYSSSKQNEGTSIERQIEMTDAFAATRGWVVSERLIDRAKSAYHAAHKKGEMGRLLARVVSGELGHGDIILVENLDRMSREKVMAAFDQLRVFTNAGVTIITVQDGQELSEKTFDAQWSRIIEPLSKMASAHFESDNKQKRGLKVWAKRRVDGVNMTTALPAWLNQDRSPRPERVAVVREIFDLCLTGKGSSVITKILNKTVKQAWGSGKPDTYTTWSSATVSKILSNRAVMGEYQPRSGGEIAGPVVADYFPQIIDPETFFKAQALIKARSFGGEPSRRLGSNCRKRTR